MPALFMTAERALTAAVAATATQYASLITDHDPDDGDHVVPGELRRFLARLRLLHGVPFSYLVPDVELLPLESIRFFYVDRAWTDALVQGVLSVGTISDHRPRAARERVPAHPQRSRRDRANDPRARRRAPAERRGRHDHGLSDAIARGVGLAKPARARLRSDVVADDALTTVAESNPHRLKVLRMERLAPAVLLVLFDGVPAVVHIEEPRQGIQFGVRLRRGRRIHPRKSAAREAARQQYRKLPSRRKMRSRMTIRCPCLSARTRQA